MNWQFSFGRKFECVIFWTNWNIMLDGVSSVLQWGRSNWCSFGANTGKYHEVDFALIWPCKGNLGWLLQKLFEIAEGPGRLKGFNDRRSQIWIWAVDLVSVFSLNLHLLKDLTLLYCIERHDINRSYSDRKYINFQHLDLTLTQYVNKTFHWHSIFRLLHWHII
jgi:hypothetical protein